MLIETTSYPRAALIGNPSDGYYGKTIAFLFSNFSARVVLYESPGLEIIPAQYDTNLFKNIGSLVGDVNLYGYYGGIRLVKAAIKKFYDYAATHGIELHKRNFTVRYSSDIPFRLGLAGSSAIITAVVKALVLFYELPIPPAQMANLVLSVEKEELKIAAGLQDRVAQAYETPVFMDFDRDLMVSRGYGEYRPIDAALLPRLYIAYRRDLSEGSDVVHNDFSERYHFGDKEVHKAIEAWTDLTVRAGEALENKDPKLLGELMDENFNIRRRVMKIAPKNIEMVETARSAGVSAKFTGSGGAIIGTYPDEVVFDALRVRLNAIGVDIIKPKIVHG